MAQPHAATQDTEFHDRMRQLDELTRAMEESASPEVREQTAAIAQGVLELHGAALRRIFAVIAESGEPGKTLIEEMSADDVISAVLVLHDLHPVALETRLKQAIADVSATLGGQNGGVELVRVSRHGVAHLRMTGKSHGCASTQASMRQTIEAAIYARAPDVGGIEIEDPATAAVDGFVPLSDLLKKQPVAMAH